MKRTILHPQLLLLVSCVLLFFTNCSNHKNNAANKTVKDTTYIIYNKDSAKTEVKITDGDTVMEDMEENAMIPVKR